MHPVIGITCDIKREAHGGIIFFLKKNYTDAVFQSGGIPLLLPPTPGLQLFVNSKIRIDGLIISGGDFDIPPEHYGESPKANLGNLIPERTDFEMAILAYATENGLPVLGICGGHQLINVYHGGSLYQDIPGEYRTTLNHSPGNSTVCHNVTINKDSLLYKILGKESIGVNSTHHQAIKKVAPGFSFSARAEDGLVEAIESDNADFIIGVQWHPEGIMSEVPALGKLFDTFIEKAEKLAMLKKQKKQY